MESESRIPETLRLFLQMCVRRLAHACCALFWQSAPSLGRNQVAAFRLPGRRHVQFQGRAYTARFRESQSPKGSRVRGDPIGILGTRFFVIARRQGSTDLSTMERAIGISETHFGSDP